jgi:hypothetical protein
LQDLIDNMPRNLPMAKPKTYNNNYTVWDGSSYKNDKYWNDYYSKKYGYPCESDFYD